MFIHGLDKISSTPTTKEVLTALRKNLETHRECLKESRAGYIKRAKELMLEKAKLLEAGEAEPLLFEISPPQDHSATYETAIQMMEMHTGETVKLCADEFRCLIMDEWNWSASWFSQNAVFSQKARTVGTDKGYIS